MGFSILLGQVVGLIFVLCGRGSLAKSSFRFLVLSGLLTSLVSILARHTNPQLEVVCH